MEFSEVLNLIVSSCPFLRGNEYDGIIIKKLAATNTISDAGASHQSHIAFTGKQKDFFPFLNADGYFNVSYEKKDDDLKKYFTLQIPLTIYKENTDDLSNKLFSLIDYTSGKKVVKASVLRSRRNNAEDQIELSIKSLDDKDFIEFRKLLRVDDFFVLLKKKNCLEYDLVGIRSTDKNAKILSKCTDFYKNGTQTPVGLENFINTSKKRNENILELSTTAKECARQIIQKIYEYDKFENIKSILRMNTNIKIDTDEICPEDVLYNVFYTAGSEQFNNEKRTFLDKEYEIRINDINITCRLTNQWCGFGEAGDETQNSRNYLWALRDIINIHYEGIFKIENDGANAKIICFNESQINKYILKYKTAYESNKTRNRIIFGAPGTGKSYKLNQDSMELIGTEIQEDIAVPKSNYYERVTFHPNFSYAQFVGTYKPITKLVDGNETISYEYVPGPFIRILIKALRNARDESEIKPYLLIIEEINRANVAAVFGDIFQLLDRNSDGISEYEIETSEDLRKYLSKSSVLGGKPDDYKKIRLPNNLFIWATMNSADQGVFPMDTAFKRRWEFEYIGINDNEEELINSEKEPFFIPICKDEIVSQKIIWNDLRKAINNNLISLGINEDKLLRPFFLSKYALESAMANGKDFVKLFESKVLMYLFEDAAKMKVRSLFNVDKYIYSEVCKKFEKDGLDVFIFNDEDKVEPIEIENKNEQQTTSENGTLF